MNWKEKKYLTQARIRQNGINALIRHCLYLLARGPTLEMSELVHRAIDLATKLEIPIKFSQLGHTLYNFRDKWIFV